MIICHDLMEVMKDKDPEKYNLNKKVDENHIFLKIVKFCAYQERSELEVEEKLKKYKLTEETTRRLINRLKEEKFIDNQRYARIYALGKLRNNKWGRIRIRYELRRKSIPEEYIEKALGLIDENEYSRMIIELIRKKKKLIHQEDHFILRNKIVQFICNKGFESDLAWELIKKEIP